jgi:hypothetical protein
VVITLKFKPAWAVRCLTVAEHFLISRLRGTKLAVPWERAVTACVFGFALSASTTADVPAARIIPVLDSRPDPRIARLERFFKAYHCPAPYYTSEYLRAADGYALDYRLLPSISIRETLCGTAAKDRHNYWGYHPGGEGFESVEAGIAFLAHRLTRHQYYKGKALRDKLFTYNPRPAYPGEVQRIMQQIE